MSILNLSLISASLAMDAFAVSICKGISIKKIDLYNELRIALYFSFFQLIMPVIGYLIGTTFSTFVCKVDHWIAFLLLSVIGLNMIKESFEEDEEAVNDKIDIKTMLLLAIATSIDALAVGITFAFIKTNVTLAVLLIGLITFILCFIGVCLGKKFGYFFKNKSEIIGGIILIIIGIKILLEHLL